MLPPAGQPKRDRPSLPAAPTESAAAAPATPPRQLARKHRGVLGAGFTPAEKRISPADDAAFQQLEIQAGGRDDLASLLEFANLGKDAQRLVGLMSDPSNDGRGLAHVAAQAGVSRAKFYGLLQAAWEARARFQAGQKIAKHLPNVVEQVMEDAQREVRPCLICDGSGQLVTGETDDQGLPTTKACGACKGTGSIVNEPATDVRKLALQMGKMIDTGGSKTTVNTLIANNNQPSGGANFDALMTKLDDVLYRESRAQHRAGYASVDGELAED
jgi:hypothetical protein